MHQENEDELHKPIIPKPEQSPQQAEPAERDSQDEQRHVAVVLLIGKPIC